MGKLSVCKMEESYLYILSLCGIYGIIFTFCLYKNPSGVTFPFYTAATVTAAFLFLKKAGVMIQKNFFLYVSGMILLGISTVMTANAFFHFFNWIGILLLLMTAMIQQINENEDWDFLRYIKIMLLLCGKTIASVFAPVTHGIKLKKSRTEKKKNKIIKSIIIGVLAAAIFLLFVLPLLVYSDKIFARYFGRILDLFKLSTGFEILFTFLFGSVILYSFFTALSGLDLTDYKVKENKNKNPVAGITFSGILAAIYVFYSVIQIIFLFLRVGGSLPEEITYSEYAHSGFWQLIVVSIINFITVLVCKNIFKENKVLKILLFIISICTCIMTLSAAYRMILYINIYYLTFLRIVVLWFLGVMILIMFGVMLSIFKVKFNLFKYITMVAAVSYIILSFAKVDKIIAEYNVTHWNQIKYEDIMYLIHGTSLDAAPVIENINLDEIENDNSYLSLEIETYFADIRDKESSWRKWNYSTEEAKRAAARYFNKKNQESL